MSSVELVLFYVVKSRGDHIGLLQTAKGGEEGLLKKMHLVDFL